jgi:hypothetical protein
MVKLINFYDLKKVKKHMLKSYNPHFKETQISLPSRIAIVGGTGSGKTSILLNYLALAQDTFIHIFVVCKMKEPLYQYLEDELKEDVTFLYDIKDLPHPNDLIELGNEGNILMVFDDCVQDKEKDQAKIAQYFLRGRKIGYGVTMFYLSQSYFSIPSFIRKQLNYIILRKVNGKTDLGNVLRENSGICDNINQLKRIYKIATREFPNFLMINLFSGDPNKTFSINFDQFIPIEDESEDEI